MGDGQQQVTDAQLDQWERFSNVGINTSTTTRALIAEVRTARTLVAELQGAVEHQRGMYEREHNTVHELQQRIDAALAISATRWHWCFKRQVVDRALIRAALTGTQSGPDQLAADQGRTGLGTGEDSGC